MSVCVGVGVVWVWCVGVGVVWVWCVGVVCGWVGGCGCAGVPVPTFGYEWGREAWGNLASVR